MSDELPEHTLTLNALLSSAASDWAPEDRQQLIEALRTQRERWNMEQSAGTGKRVTSKQIPTTKPDPSVKAGARKLSLAGLKL